MKVCELKILLMETLMKERGLKEFAEIVSRIDPESFKGSEELSSISQELCDIIEEICESGKSFLTHSVEKQSGKTSPHKEEFREDILNTFEKLIRFLVVNPDYDCDASEQKYSFARKTLELIEKEQQS